MSEPLFNKSRRERAFRTAKPKLNSGGDSAIENHLVAACNRKGLRARAFHRAGSARGGAEVARRLVQGHRPARAVSEVRSRSSRNRFGRISGGRLPIVTSCGLSN